MSDWRERMEDGEAPFQRWFDEKLELLVDALNEPRGKAFPGEIRTIREKLDINYDTSRQRELLTHLFLCLALGDQLGAFLNGIECLKIREALAKERNWPQDWEDLAIILIRLAPVELIEEKTRLAYLKQARAIYERLHEEHPGNSHYADSFRIIQSICDALP